MFELETNWLLTLKRNNKQIMLGQQCFDAPISHVSLSNSLHSQAMVIKSIIQRHCMHANMADACVPCIKPCCQMIIGLFTKVLKWNLILL